MNNLFLESDMDYVNPTDICNSKERFAIRCVAKRPSYNLTVTYNTGISSVQVDGSVVQNGETISLEEKSYHSITMTVDAGYYSYWSATSGTISSNEDLATAYTMSSDNAILTANASYIDTEIQNLSSNNCTATASRVRDNRDNHVYIIQRLADDNCWMMENLDLGRTDLTTDLTPSNTNLTSTVTASTFNGWKDLINSRTYTVGQLLPLDGIDSISKTPYGTVYNYCATSAGTICTESYTRDMTNDICPAGWRLPTGAVNTGEFAILYSKSEYHSYDKMRAPIADGGAAFALAGQLDSYGSASKGSTGYYWSSTHGPLSNSTGGNTLRIEKSSSAVYAGTGIIGSVGNSIRCILKS